MYCSRQRFYRKEKEKIETKLNTNKQTNPHGIFLPQMFLFILVCPPKSIRPRWRRTHEFGISPQEDEEADGSQALELGFLLEFFDAGTNLVSPAFFFRLADHSLHERVVPQRFVVLFSLKDASK